AQGSIDADSNFSTQLATWQSDGKSFGEVNVSGDIATLFYNTLQPDQLYLDPNPTTLSSPYAQIELGGVEAATEGPLGAAFGVGVAAYAGIEAHLLSTMIDIQEENLSNPPSNQPVSISEPDAASIVSDSQTCTLNTNSDGSTSVTETGESQFSVTISQFSVTMGSAESNAANFLISGSDLTEPISASMSASNSYFTSTITQADGQVNTAISGQGVFALKIMTLLVS